MSEDDYDPDTDPEISKSALRSIADVVTMICLTIGQLEHVGISVEPIAMLIDPDDDIEGDYVIRVCFEVRAVDDKFFVKVFHANIVMGLFLRMNDERLARNMYSLYRRAKEFQDDTSRDLHEAGWLTGEGMQTLSDVIRNTSRKGKH